jgi:DNA-binding FadR family transcriptional regulator
VIQWESERTHINGKSGCDLRSWVKCPEHSAVARAIEAGDPDAISIEIRDFG